jgi:Fe/S biogenesis protein NfuA
MIQIQVLERQPMFTITPAALEKLKSHLAAKSEADLAVRLAIIGRGQEGFRYDFRIIFQRDQLPTDQIIPFDGFNVVVDPESVPHLDGTVLDLKDDGGFRIDNPNPVWEDEQGPAVLELIESKINPAVAMHGGKVSLVDVRDGVVYISFGGGCQGCGMANVTLKEGVHKMLHEAVPGIRDIVDMTDHALGTNPYFRPGMVGQSAVPHQR